MARAHRSGAPPKPGTVLRLPVSVGVVFVPGARGRPPRCEGSARHRGYFMALSCGVVAASQRWHANAVDMVWPGAKVVYRPWHGRATVARALPREVVYGLIT
jgi:hypothetical protein